jgi:hypothetical protein
MGNETFLAYWNGEEPTGPDGSPTLAQIPDTVDVVILFAANITHHGDLDFSGLVTKNDQLTIVEWMKEIRARQTNLQRKTKFFLSIFIDWGFPTDADEFAQKVVAAVRSWGVDGIDIDNETPDGLPSAISGVQAIKKALPAGSLLTTCIWQPWEHLDSQSFANYTALFDYIMTMDYTPYIGYEKTIRRYESFAKKMGGDSAACGKLAIGVSCMEFQGDGENNHTPLEDVKKFCSYEPSVKGARKLGVMLYSLSYDAPGHRSPYPLFTYTNVIAQNLP